MNEKKAIDFEAFSDEGKLSLHQLCGLAKRVGWLKYFVYEVQYMSSRATEDAILTDSSFKMVSHCFSKARISFAVLFAADSYLERVSVTVSARAPIAF